MTRRFYRMTSCAASQLVGWTAGGRPVNWGAGWLLEGSYLHASLDLGIFFPGSTVTPDPLLGDHQHYPRRHAFGSEQTGNLTATEDDELEADRCLARHDTAHAAPVILQSRHRDVPHCHDIGEVAYGRRELADFR